jgi:hypothetical protein
MFTAMHAIITIFQAEFANKENIRRIINDLSVDVQEIQGASIYSPKSGKLMEFLTILRENKIAYGTHFNTLDNTVR